MGLLDNELDNAHHAEDNELESARHTISLLIAQAKDDPTALLSKEAIQALRVIEQHDPVEYEKIRTQVKQANSKIRVGALDTFIKQESGDDKGPKSLTSKLVELALTQCELWHDSDGCAYASFERKSDKESHREHWRIDASGFQEWLSLLSHKELGETPSGECIRSACNMLTGQAKFDGPEHHAFMRVAKDQTDHYWIDLCDERWRALRITAHGWNVVDTPEVRFVRTQAMRPLPYPSTDGSIEPLWNLANIPKLDRPLVLAWMLEGFRPDTPYPALELIGEQGSAKSTTQETLRQFMDPNKVMLRGRPRTVEDVFVAAGANHVISLENLSGISAELSDALCTISTGGGQAARQLFTNGEEHIIEAHNPVMLNGIGAVVTRPDLLDRTIALCIPTISSRMTEGEHAAILKQDAPAIMGGLLSLFSKTLSMIDKVQIPAHQRPRMADFAQLGEAMFQSMGEDPGQWLSLYVGHRRDAIQRTLDSNPVAQACIDLLERGRQYSGNVKGLLELLNSFQAQFHIERGDYWPRSPKGLGDALRRVAPALRQVGVFLEVENKPRRDGIHCHLRRS